MLILWEIENDNVQNQPYYDTILYAMPGIAGR